jgi:hypothetical protein
MLLEVLWEWRLAANGCAQVILCKKRAVKTAPGEKRLKMGDQPLKIDLTIRLMPKASDYVVA